MDVILKVALEETHLEVIWAGCLLSESSSEVISRDLADLLLEDSTFSFLCRLKYPSSSYKMLGFSATNLAIWAMASSFVGGTLGDPCSSDTWSC